MIWLLGGYMWLYIHRPFEVWPTLGTLQIERAYMLGMLLIWLVWPGKGLIANRTHLALLSFTVALVLAWISSPFASQPGCLEVVENYAKVAVFYVLLVTSVREERSLRLLMLLFLTAIGCYVLHSLWEFLHGRYQWRMGIRRMIGVDSTYSDPNAFASTLLYTLPFVLPFWNEQPRRIARPILLGFILVILLCILLTGSRAGFMGLCLLGLILVLASAKQKLRALLIGGVAAGFGLLLLSVVLPEELQNRYLTILDSSRGPTNAQTSADGRIDGILWGLYLWGESPLIGFGPGSFAYCTGKGLQAHNLYGQLLSELGSFGAIAFIALLVCFWRNCGEAAQATPLPERYRFDYQVARAAGINVLLLLFLGCAGHNLYRYNWLWFAAFSAIAVHCLRIRCLAESSDEVFSSFAPESTTLGQLRPEG